MASVAYQRSAEHEAEELFARHADDVLRFCRRHTASEAEAEDAAQTTFLYAFRALRRGVVPECEPAWLTAIAKNVCHAQRRTAARRPLDGSHDLDRIGLAASDDGDRESVGELLAAIATLPERQRRVLLMREWQGLATREIATELDLTPTATQALLTRARQSVATAVRRPLAALHLPFALDVVRAQLRSLLAGSAAKVGAGSVAVAVAVGGASELSARPSEPRTAVSPTAAPTAETADPSSLLPSGSTKVGAQPSEPARTALARAAPPVSSRLPGSPRAAAEHASRPPRAAEAPRGEPATPTAGAAVPVLPSAPTAEPPAAVPPAAVPPVPDLGPVDDVVPPLEPPVLPEPPALPGVPSAPSAPEVPTVDAGVGLPPLDPARLLPPLL